jgi:hypothetical protein
MTVEVRHDRHRHGLPAGDMALLGLPAAQPVLARIAAATDPEYPYRTEHILRVATIAVQAKLRPSNAYAKPTLIRQTNTTDPNGDDLGSQNAGRVS